MYLHHVKRAQGRTISFHHISKCGGTTMCQLAATNRCSNPHLTIEKNCVVDDRCAQTAAKERLMLSHMQAIARSSVLPFYQPADASYRQ